MLDVCKMITKCICLLCYKVFRKILIVTFLIIVEYIKILSQVMLLF